MAAVQTQTHTQTQTQTHTQTHTVRLGRFTVPLTARHADLAPWLPSVLAFGPFQAWTHRLGQQLESTAVGRRVHVAGVQVTDVDFFGHGRLGFVKFHADMRWIDGAAGAASASGKGSQDSQDSQPAVTGPPLPGIVFCRGGAVAVLLIVRASKPAASAPAATTASTASTAAPAAPDGQRWVVLTVQPRVPIGLLEETALPAGMLDGDANFAGVAAKELQEECGITIASTDLVDLTAYRTLDDAAIPDADWDPSTAGLYPSAGGCDEFIRLFLCEKELPAEQIRELEGRETGLRDEGERIKLKLVRLEDLWRSTRDMKALAALALMHQRGDL